MKILIATLAFTNSDLLARCLNSWYNHIPSEIAKGLLWQGNFPMEDVINKHQKNLNVYIKRINNYFVSGGWNIILREAFKNNYTGVVMVGSDTAFQKGFWDSFAKDLDTYDFVESSHEFNCFYISKKCFSIVGSFDENLSAYCEDDDYRTRYVKTGIKYKTKQGEKELFLHEHSATAKRNAIHQFKIYKGFQLNKEYMTRKWGGVQNSIPKWKPVYETPFNDPDWPLDKWVLEPEGRIKRLWGNIVNDPSDKRLKPLLDCLNGKGVYDNNTKEI